MKMRLLSALVLLGCGGLARAENLMDIYQLAEKNDSALLQTQAQRDAAFEKINETDAALLPQVNLAADTGYQKTSQDDRQTAKTASTTLSLTQSVYNRSNWINSDITNKQAILSDVTLNLAKQNLMLNTAQAYFSVLAARDTLEYAKANQEALKRQLDETQQRFQVGMVAITDVHQAKAAYDLAAANVITAENTLNNSYESLRQLTGTEHRELNGLDVQRFSPVSLADNANDWLKRAQDKNLTLLQQRITKDIAKQQIDLAQAGHQPTLDFSTGLSSAYTDYKNSSSQDGTLNTASIGFKFNLPLYSGGSITSQVKQAQYNFVAASEGMENTYRGIQVNLFSYYNNVNAAIGQVKAYQQAVISSQSALTATQAGYQVGTQTIVDVLTSTTQLYSAKQQLSAARFNYILAILQLKLTAGTLNEQDLNDINGGLLRN